MPHAIFVAPDPAARDRARAEAEQALGGAISRLWGRAFALSGDAIEPEKAKTFARRRALALAITPAPPLAPKLLLADMDSTITPHESLVELARHLGCGEAIARITERAMAGELDFVRAFEERIAMLKGAPSSLLDQLAAEYATPRPGARSLIETMRASGARCVLVSGGFDPFLSFAAKAAGFDGWFGNALEIEDGVLTGRAHGPILGAEAKAERLAAESAALGVDRARTMAIGDGANDIAMIEAAGIGVGFMAKPALARVANAWIDRDDIAAAAYFAGLEPD